MAEQLTLSLSQGCNSVEADASCGDGISQVDGLSLRRHNGLEDGISRGGEGGNEGEEGQQQ